MQSSDPLLDSTPRPSGGPIVALLWACFLGSSWTWIIGMFLPILLVRDYGLWGWVVFAVPNVLGAAAMGTVLRSAAASIQVVRRHSDAAQRFSEVTVAYHVFVVGWIYSRLFGWRALVVTAAVAIIVMAMARKRWSVLLVTLLVTLISLVMGGMWLNQPDVFGALNGAAPPRLTGLDLLLFAPASIVGFALCPYLDLTFHRARRATTPVTGQFAFAIGFCVVFLAMIVFTLLYAVPMRSLFRDGLSFTLPTPLATILVVHMTLQAGLTIGLHLRELALLRGHAAIHRVVSLSVAAGALAWWALSEPSRLIHGLAVGEVIYRCFLLFYGMVFPAYVWLCMIPMRRPLHPGLRLTVLIVSLLLAVPMGYAGFVMGQSWWLAGAIGVLVIARLVMMALPDWRMAEKAG